MATQHKNPYNSGTVTVGTGTTTVNMQDAVYNKLLEQYNPGYITSSGGTSLKSSPKVLSHEDLEEAGELLHNILQDALVVCEEDCCAEEASNVDFVALGQALVTALINEYAISSDEKKKLQEHLAFAQAEAVSLKRELGAVAQRTADEVHEKRLNSFKSRTYPPSFTESPTYSTNTSEVHSTYNKEK